MNISKSLYYNRFLQWAFVYVPLTVFIVGNIVKSFYDYSERFYGLVINDIPLAFLVAYLFYYVLVYTPLELSRKRVKRRLQESFLDFKKNVTALLLQAGELKVSGPEEAEKLLVVGGFQAFFNGTDENGMNRWQAVTLGLANTPALVEDITAEMVFLKEEMWFALGHAEIPNDEVFELVKDVSLIIYKYKNKCVRSDSDNLAWFSGLLWRIFTEFPWIAGHKKDMVKNYES